MRPTTMNINPYHVFIGEGLSSYVVGGNKFLLLEDGLSLFLAKRSSGVVIANASSRSSLSSFSPPSCSSSSHLYGAGSSSGLLASSSSLDVDANGFKFVHASRQDTVKVIEKEYMLIAIDPRDTHISIFDSSWSLLANEQGRHGRLDSCMKKSILHFSPVHYTEKYKNKAGDTLIAHVYFSLAGRPIACVANIVKSDGSKEIVDLTLQQVEKLKCNAEPIEATFQQILQEHEKYVQVLENEINTLDKSLAERSQNILRKETNIKEKRKKISEYEDLGKIFSIKIREINKICCDRYDVRDRKIEEVLVVLKVAVEGSQVGDGEMDNSKSMLASAASSFDDKSDVSSIDPVKAQSKQGLAITKKQEILQKDMDEFLISLDTAINEFSEYVKGSTVLDEDFYNTFRDMYVSIDRLKTKFECEITIRFLDLECLHDSRIDEIISINAKILQKLQSFPTIKELIIAAIYKANVPIIKCFYPVAAHFVTVDLLIDLFGLCLYKHESVLAVDLELEPAQKEKIGTLKSLVDENPTINHGSALQVFNALYDLKSVAYFKFLRMISKTLLIQPYNSDFSVSCLAACCERGYVDLFTTLVNHIGDIDNCVGCGYRGSFVSLLSFTFFLDDVLYLQNLLQNGANVDAPCVLRFSEWKEAPFQVKSLFSCEHVKPVKKEKGKALLESRKLKEHINEVNEDFFGTINQKFCIVYVMEKKCFEKIFANIFDSKSRNNFIFPACNSLHIFSLYYNKGNVSTDVREENCPALSVWDPEMCFLRMQHAVQKIAEYVFKKKKLCLLQTSKSEDYRGEELLSGACIMSYQGELGTTPEELLLLAAKLRSSNNIVCFIDIKEDTEECQEVGHSIVVLNIIRSIFVCKNMTEEFDRRSNEIATSFYDKMRNKDLSLENRIISSLSIQLLLAYMINRRIEPLKDLGFNVVRNCLDLIENNMHILCDRKKEDLTMKFMLDMSVHPSLDKLLSLVAVKDLIDHLFIKLDDKYTKTAYETLDFMVKQKIEQLEGLGLVSKGISSQANRTFKPKPKPK